MFKQINLTIFCLLLSTMVMAQNTVQDYVNRFSTVAVSEMQRTGIPASLILAEGILTSSFGNSQLALQANNHFNLECAREWNGEFFYKWDKSKQTQRPSCFRVYSKPEESFLDFTTFLISNSDVAALALDEQHYKKWVKLLVEAGATTKTTEQIIRVIEQFTLTDFDDIQSYAAAPKMPSREIITVSGIKAVAAKSADTPLSIALELGIPYKKILKFNDLTEESTIAENQYIFIESKRNQSDLEVEYHIIRSGETLYDVAQLYGVRLKNLCKLNHIGIQDKIANGERVYLREEAPMRPRLKGEQLPSGVKIIPIQPGPQPKPISEANTEEKPLAAEENAQSKIITEEDNPVPDISAVAGKPNISPNISDNNPTSAPVPNISAFAEKPDIQSSAEENIPSAVPIPGMSATEQKPGTIPTTIENAPSGAPIPIMENEGEKPTPTEKIPTGAPVPIMEGAGYIAPVPGKSADEADADLAPIPGRRASVRPQEGTSPTDAANSGDLPPGQGSAIFGDEGIIVPPSRPDPKDYLLNTDLTADEPDSAADSPTKPTTIIPTPPKPREGYHIVAAGETLYRIATRYKISVASLKEMNGLKDNTIEIGQELKIKK